MHFQLTRDWGYLRLVATDPRLWDHLSDDFAPAAEEWQPTDSPAMLYVKVSDDGEALGFFLLACFSPILFQVHTALLPSAWGAKAKEAARELVAWVWRETTCQRLTTEVPACNRLALAFAKRAGMTEYGRNPRAYQKNGELVDLILLGLSRPKELVTCQ